MPRKIRQLAQDLMGAGFALRSGGKGSHRKFTHPNLDGFALLSGKDGEDAKHYQEKHVRDKIRESKS